MRGGRVPPGDVLPPGVVNLPMPLQQRALRRLLPGVAAAVAACGHSDAWTPVAPPPNPPIFVAGAQQLTTQLPGDWAPAWLPDGSGIGYSYERSDRRDRDRCIGWLPAAGGRIGALGCYRVDGDLGDDTANVIAVHAVSPGGRLAFYYQASRGVNFAPAYGHLLVGGRAAPGQAVPVVDFPYTSETGVPHSAVRNLVWLDEAHLAWVAVRMQYNLGGPAAPPDTNDYGVEIVVLDLEPVLTRRVVPGSQGASSLALDRATGLVYATFALDSVVYGLDLATGARTPAMDFSGWGTVRDVQVANGTMVAVVGGVVTPVPASMAGVDSQNDLGGWIVSVPLAGGPLAFIATDPARLFRSLALSPAGDRVVAEGFDNFAKASDLWMMVVP